MNSRLADVKTNSGLRSVIVRWRSKAFWITDKTPSPTGKGILKYSFTQSFPLGEVGRSKLSTHLWFRSVMCHWPAWRIHRLATFCTQGFKSNPSRYLTVHSLLPSLQHYRRVLVSARSESKLLGYITESSEIIIALSGNSI